MNFTNNHTLKKGVGVLMLGLFTLSTSLFTLSSCTKADSDLVSFVEDNTLSTPNDTVYSLIGIVNKLQKIADRTILLGELRGDLTSLTDHASLDLQALANFEADATNPYNDARDYYAIIQNCNYFLANADTTLMKRGDHVFEKEYAAISAFRAWTYLQLAINYGSVPFYTQPILTEKEADPSLYPHYDVEQIANYFIDDLAPYVDTKTPQYGAIGNYDSQFFYIPVRVLLGDLCLWAGRYQEAAKYYHDYFTKQGDTHPILNNYVRWSNRNFENISDAYASTFTSTQRGQLLTLIPMEETEYDGIITRLPDVFNSTEKNNYFYQATHSPAYDELSQSQRFVMIETDPLTSLSDTIAPSDTTFFASNSLRGDLRQQSIYTLRANPSASNAFSAVRQQCNKYQSQTSVCLYRIQHVYLRYAEALNRAGYPNAAFCVLKFGLCKDYWSQDYMTPFLPDYEREAAGDLISFSEYTFDRSNTMGIHSRGCGDANADTTYVIGFNKATGTIDRLATLSDSILYVENKICEEMALETAAEGLRYYDLMRLSLHRNDPTFLADKVARRDGTLNAALFTKLSDKKNWFLPLE